MPSIGTGSFHPGKGIFGSTRMPGVLGPSVWLEPIVSATPQVLGQFPGSRQEWG